MLCHTLNNYNRLRWSFHFAAFRLWQCKLKSFGQIALYSLKYKNKFCNYNSKCNNNLKLNQKVTTLTLMKMISVVILTKNRKIFLLNLSHKIHEIFNIDGNHIKEISQEEIFYS